MKSPFSINVISALVALRFVSCHMFVLAQAKSPLPPNSNHVVSNTTNLPEGMVRYHYYFHQEDDHVSGTKNYGNFLDVCATALVLGVGTSLQVEDYDLVAKSIAEQSPGMVVLVVDHAPGNPLKTSATRYAALVQALAGSLHNLVLVCQTFTTGRQHNETSPAIDNEPKPRNYLVGGHSASGEAALQALPYLLESPLRNSIVGVVGLSPFRLTPLMPSRIPIPALFWGFSHSTCGVDIAHAADQGYNSSPNQTRVLYQLENPWGQPNHCVFTDRGCGLVCPRPYHHNNPFEWVHQAVGASIHQFIVALQSKQFTRTALALSLPTNESVRMVVNDDKLPPPVTTTTSKDSATKLQASEQ